MNTIFLIAAYALILSSGAAFSHENSPLASNTVAKEQKEWGIAGEASSVSRTINLSMADTMRFSPDLISVKQGETIRFVVRNRGKTLHEIVLGTRKELEAHAALMLKFPGMEHSEPYMAHVAPGKTGTIIWKFNRSGHFDFACLMPGHYQAGMVGTIEVATQ